MTVSSMRCCFCGRLTLHPAAYIGAYPVGATCARKHGLLERRMRGKAHAVRFVKDAARRASTAKRDGLTLDLFEGAA